LHAEILHANGTFFLNLVGWTRFQPNIWTEYNLIKKIQKYFFKNSFNFFFIFLHVFLPVLINIWLYTYNVRYKSSIIYPVFSETFLKNSKKKSQNF
jgi:hypothetical protein